MPLSKITMYVTDEQRKELLTFLQNKNWDVEMEIEETATAMPVAEAAYVPPPMPQHAEGVAECPLCLCSPCIINEQNKQLWWPANNRPPHNLNSHERKLLYRRFWAMLYNCGAWKDVRYIERKVAARRGDCTWHKRELMPECVVQQCRNWLPNPRNQPYLGHKWS